MLSEKEKALRVLLFDSFCRTVLRNAIRNYCKQNTRLQKAEFLTDNPASFCNIEESSTDEYNSEHFFIKFKGSAYALDNESLCKAMQELPERELGVLILGYWCGKTDRQIAHEYGVSDRTVRNLRNRAFRAIRRKFS